MKTEQGGWRETRDTKSRGKRSVEREDNERNGKNQCLVHSRNVCWSKHACRPHIEQWAGCFGLPRHAPKVHFPEGWVVSYHGVGYFLIMGEEKDVKYVVVYG